MNEKNFYDHDFKAADLVSESEYVDLLNPQAIYRYLLKHVYKQDEYCKKASMILYNHIMGRRSRTAVCGAPGSGKTHVAQYIRRLWPKTIIIDSSTLSKEGWSGSRKVHGFLNEVDPASPDYIVVFDEFDKMVVPQHNSKGENISATVQSEFLKLIEGERITVNKGGKQYSIDTSQMSFIFCGSFAICAAEKAAANSTRHFGFLADEHIEKPYESKLTLNDIMEFGVIPEIASRLTDVININTLTVKDFEYMLCKHDASPIKQLEAEYMRPIRVTNKKLKALAKEAYESGLGVRYAYAALKRQVDEALFTSFDTSDGGADEICI